MLTKSALMGAVAAALAAEWPNADVHVNLAPADFTRPAFLLEAPRVSRRDVNAGLIEETCYLTVTCFEVVDDYGQSDTDALAALQERVLALFRRGILTVEDRAVRLLASEGGMDFDRAWVDLQCAYREARDPHPVPLPLMREINTKTTLQEG